MPRALTLVAFLLLPVIAAASTLAESPSELLRGQAAAAVRWQPWNEDSLAAARASGRSVYVFVGSTLSELTRATLEQTLARPETAAWLNEHFFCILVDADHQPEVAAYAQHFINTARQLRGWPVHLWLTPELQPYDGANYLPPTEEWGRPGFLKSARAALDAWTIEPARARALAAEALALLPPVSLGTDLEPARLDRAAAAWVAAADTRHGGFGAAPKQPEPELIRFLLGRGPGARAAALAAARALVGGAVRDRDGGFFRRASDAAWREPYRQKLLADQARIALALFAAAEAGGAKDLRAAGVGALEFVRRDLRRPDGRFAAALDGTLGEGRAPVMAGTASTGALGLLVAALHRSGEPSLVAEAGRLADSLRGMPGMAESRPPHLPGGTAPATATDLAGMAVGFRALGDAATADRLLATARDRYFDPTPGLYLASAPPPLPAGLALRAPAGDDPLPAEVLALWAGEDGPAARQLRRTLAGLIAYDDLPPGAVLLALAGE